MPRDSRSKHIIAEQERRDEITRELRAKGIDVQPLAPEAAAQLAHELEAAKREQARLGPLVSYFVDLLEILQARAVVDYWAERGGIEAIQAAGDLADFNDAWERRKLPEMSPPLGAWTEEELETANSRATSIWRARMLAPMRVLGNQMETFVVDAQAEYRFQAIRRAWLMPVIALATGGVSAYAATAAQFGAAASVSGFALQGAMRARTLAGLAPVPGMALRLDTFVGWSSGMFVDPVTAIVAGTPPMDAPVPFVEESKELLMNAAWAAGGRAGAFVGILLLVEFLAGFFGEEHGLVKMIRERIAEGE